MGYAPALAGFAKVYSGKSSLVLGRSPKSIVIFPIEGGYDSPHDVVGSLVDVDLKLAAHLWGANLDEAWDLRQRFIQALRQQAIGNPLLPAQATPAQQGAYYEMLSEAWDTSPDTAEQGQELEILFTIRCTASTVIQLSDGGPIASTSIAPSVPSGADYPTLLLALRAAGGVSPRSYWTLDYGTKLAGAAIADRGSGGQTISVSGAWTDQQSFVPSGLTGAARTVDGFASLAAGTGSIPGSFSIEMWATINSLADYGIGMYGWPHFVIGNDIAGHFVIVDSGTPIVTSSRTYPAPARHYVVARYNTVGTVWDLWVDGTLAGSAVRAAPSLSGQVSIQADGNDAAFQHPAITLGLLSQAQQIATTALADLF